MIDEAQASRWLDSYRRAWEEADPNQIVELFTADASYFETPFAPPAIGRDTIRAYWQKVPETQRDVRFGYRILGVSKRTVVAHWEASFRRADKCVQLDGMFVLEFSADGLCETLREWWHRNEVASV